MPDWGGIRAAAVTVGVREAARQASSHLPEDEQRRFTERVMKRSSREGWLTSASEAKELAISKGENTQAMPLSANVRTGAEIMENTLESHGKATRYSLSKATLAGADHAAQLSGHDVLKQARNLKELAGTASILHGWTGEQPIVRINVMQKLDERTVEGPVIDI